LISLEFLKVNTLARAKTMPHLLQAKKTLENPGLNVIP
jgi:hypothetical protein